MKLMNRLRIIMALWGFTCLVFVGLGHLGGIITKMSTPMAFSAIESSYIKLDSLSEEQLKDYDFLKSRILLNGQGQKNSSAKARKYLTRVGLGNAIIFFVLAIFLPSIKKRLTEPKPGSY
ncbi:hypothetical protein RI845_02105 [Thalassotalea nanhaiensis]|uniref:Uncharacterized protein n=1 Tax=Thalassotalea nanhaiensis TaxID=3065648 RepID=A0ABY9TMI3_9GAMM|nr:hypothetical protein RI845_02105 [Colwelliaceae bacterium SQ345]